MDSTFIDVVINKLQWLIEHPEVTWSGSGIYALSLAGSAVLTVAACVRRRKKKSPPSSEEHLRQPLPVQKTNNQFNSGGEQNIAQGDHATGKLVNNHGPVISTSGDQSPAVNAQTVTITYGVVQEKYDQIKKDLDIGDAAFASFFKILEQGSIPREEWGAKLPEIAFRYKELLLRFEAVTSDDPQVRALKEQAKQAIENGEYDRADALLNQAKERDRAAVATLKASLAEQQAALEKRQLSEAQSCVEQADLQRLQYRYEKSAQYWQEAAAALPEGYERGRADCLNAAGNDLHSIASYADALHLYKRSLFISRKIGDRKGEAKLLSNIGSIFQAQGDYGKAFDYLEQSLPLFLELGDKKGECTTLNNIATIYLANGDYSKARKYFEQNLMQSRNIHDKAGEGGTLNNLVAIYSHQGDYATALQYATQALSISREIKDNRLENMCLNNIGTIYYEQGNYDAALELLEQSLAIRQQIGERRGEGATLNQISMVYKAKGDYPSALKQYEKSLAIAKEIGDKDGESATSGNIGVLLIKQGEVAKAEPYLSRAVELEAQLEHPLTEKHREVLEKVRITLRENSAQQ